MGNLARATYLDTTDYMWPFSTNACNNKTRYAQEINACNDNPKFGMQPNRGRGAAEIDFLEVMFMVSKGQQQDREFVRFCFRKCHFNPLYLFVS